MTKLEIHGQTNKRDITEECETKLRRDGDAVVPGQNTTSVGNFAIKKPVHLNGPVVTTRLGYVLQTVI